MRKSGSGISESIISLSSKLFKPKVDSSNIHNFKRNELIPSNKILYDFENESYKTNAEKNLDDFILIDESPTLKFYLKNNVIIVAIRGTFNLEDVVADLKSVFGQVEQSQRYINDEKFLKRVQIDYPKKDYIYLSVSHSLGGMITDIFLSKGLIEQGISYNPAVEAKYSNNSNHLRMYASKDEILFSLMGRYASNTEVRQSKAKKGIISKILKFTVGTPLTSVKLHLLSTPEFIGGIFKYKHHIYIS